MRGGAEGFYRGENYLANSRRESTRIKLHMTSAALLEEAKHEKGAGCCAV